MTKGNINLGAMVSITLVEVHKTMLHTSGYIYIYIYGPFEQIFKGATQVTFLLNLIKFLKEVKGKMLTTRARYKVVFNS